MPRSMEECHELGHHKTYHRPKCPLCQAFNCLDCGTLVLTPPQRHQVRVVENKVKALCQDCATKRFKRRLLAEYDQAVEEEIDRRIDEDDRRYHEARDR